MRSNVWQWSLLYEGNNTSGYRRGDVYKRQICHGSKLDGNGPLYKGGDGPYPAKPATLVGDAKYENMPAGQMFYSVTYGKNLMGSYASQLDTKQRWMVIHYIKMKQAAAQSAANTNKTDSTKVK